jgi:hypothetical protein
VMCDFDIVFLCPWFLVACAFRRRVSSKCAEPPSFL